MKHTAVLTAQNTSVKVCDIQSNGDDPLFANACVSGTFGGGTVTFSISHDNGTTKYPLTQDGTNSAASLTALGCVNIRLGNIRNNEQLELYASIGAATTPSVTINVFDNK